MILDFAIFCLIGMIAGFVLRLAQEIIEERKEDAID